MSVRFSDDEFAQLKSLLLIYEWGQRTLMTKLNIVQEDLSSLQGINPIEYIKGRIKSPESIAQKLHRLNVPITAESAKHYLKDIAGIRIICTFAKDILYITEILRAMPEVKIIEEKDYVTAPKLSGYRSYHIITEVPVFYSGKNELVAVELQLRTEAMNFWASLEHKVRYKYQEHIPQHLCDALVCCADQTAELDHRMFLIHEIVSLINENT